MNLLDIILIIIGILILIGGFAGLIYMITEYDPFSGIICFVFCLIIVFLVSILPFIIVDKASGVTIGEITSVDKNFFGTDAIYLKVNEATQEKGCIEDKELAKMAQELVGKKVKVTYGTRIGLYSTGSCHTAPIEKIELIEE